MWFLRRLWYKNIKKTIMKTNLKFKTGIFCWWEWMKAWNIRRIWMLFGWDSKKNPTKSTGISGCWKMSLLWIKIYRSCVNLISLIWTTSTNRSLIFRNLRKIPGNLNKTSKSKLTYCWYFLVVIIVADFRSAMRRLAGSSVPDEWRDGSSSKTMVY